MSRLFIRCSYDESFLGKGGDLLSAGAIGFSIGKGGDLLSAGATGFSIGNDSVEYKLGSNPRGEIERMVVSTWDGEATWGPESTGEAEMERGDIVGAMLEGSSLNEPEDASSGLAMRKPPRDWERLKSPSIAGVPNDEAGGVICPSLCRFRSREDGNCYEQCGGA